MSEHHRKLERMYLGAACNAYYAPTIAISDGRAEVSLPVVPQLFHAAGAVHGSAYFKALDDACFFAASSLDEERFVLTASFSLHFLRPVTEGELRAVGEVVERSRRRTLAEGVLYDAAGRVLARGGGSFMPSDVELSAEMGYA